MDLTMDEVAKAVRKNWPNTDVMQPDEGLVFRISGEHSTSLLHLVPAKTDETIERLSLQLWADFFHPDGREVDWQAIGFERSLVHCHFINDALDWCTMRAQGSFESGQEIRPLLNRAVAVFMQDITYAHEGDPGSSLLLGIMDLISEWNLVDPIVHALADGTIDDCTHVEKMLHTALPRHCS